MKHLSLDDCDAIFDKALRSCSTEEFANEIEPLWGAYEIMSVGIGRGRQLFWRARILDGEWFDCVDHLDYPPPEFARCGRLNDAGAPAFYISLRETTAIAEVIALPGQAVQLAAFRPKPDVEVRLAVIGEYANVERTGYMQFGGRDPGGSVNKLLNEMPREQAQVSLYIDRFFASVLSDPHARDVGYLHSRALGSAIYARNGSKGIVYPSVRDRGGMNIAVQAAESDRCFDNVACLVVNVGRRRRFGFVEYTAIGSAERIDDDGNFVWYTDYQPPLIGMYNLTKAEFEAGAPGPDGKPRVA